MTFTLDYIVRVSERLRNRSKQCLERRDYDSAIQYLSCMAYLKYSFYQGYCDGNIENDIKTISNTIVRHHFNKDANKNLFVFYDSFACDNQGLTEQYLDALINNNFELIYITRVSLERSKSSNVRQALEGYNKAQILQVPTNLSGVKCSQWIYDAICNSGAAKLLMQLAPDDIEECVAFAALPPEITRYQINLTDHTFWVGTNVMDYSFEFRPYGCNLSHNKRGFPKDRLLLQPFYPIMKSIPFEGFPQECEGKFIFFTGGAIYKMMDSELTFFRLCKNILDKIPDSVILVAGGTKDDKTINDAIVNFNMQGRMIPIGLRRDIYEVFKHCDVFINTYPVGGGLMSQFAAQCSKPILNYMRNECESVIGQKKKCEFTSYSEESFISEAVHFYKEPSYRKQVGEYLNSAVITQEEFRDTFYKAITSNCSSYDIQWETDFVENKLDVKNAIKYANETWGTYYGMYHRLKNKMFRLSPYMFIKLQVHRFVKKFL